nr:MAG TPA: hypothetical protein [Caudoviricetes sp.]
MKSSTSYPLRDSAFVYLQIRRSLFTSEDFFFHLESPFIGLT